MNSLLLLISLFLPAQNGVYVGNLSNGPQTSRVAVVIGDHDMVVYFCSAEDDFVANYSRWFRGNIDPAGHFAIAQGNLTVTGELKDHAIVGAVEGRFQAKLEFSALPVRQSFAGLYRVQALEEDTKATYGWIIDDDGLVVGSKAGKPRKKEDTEKKVPDEKTVTTAKKPASKTSPNKTPRNPAVLKKDASQKSKATKQSLEKKPLVANITKTSTDGKAKALKSTKLKKSKVELADAGSKQKSKSTKSATGAKIDSEPDGASESTSANKQAGDSTTPTSKGKEKSPAKEKQKEKQKEKPKGKQKTGDENANADENNNDNQANAAANENNADNENNNTGKVLDAIAKAQAKQNAKLEKLAKNVELAAQNAENAAELAAEAADQGEAENAEPPAAQKVLPKALKLKRQAKAKNPDNAPLPGDVIEGDLLGVDAEKRMLKLADGDEVVEVPVGDRQLIATDEDGNRVEEDAESASKEEPVAEAISEMIKKMAEKESPRVRLRLNATTVTAKPLVKKK